MQHEDKLGTCGPHVNLTGPHYKADEVYMLGTEERGLVLKPNRSWDGSVGTNL